MTGAAGDYVNGALEERAGRLVGVVVRPIVVLNATLVGPRAMTGGLSTTVVLNATLVPPRRFGPRRRYAGSNRSGRWARCAAAISA